KGHILLEGVPGVAKTTMIKVVTKALGLTFKRVQFTPDLLPSDLIGTLIYNPKTQEFETKKGPIFAHLVLADEINRASAKVQSALLEAMQEQQVTLGSNTYALDKPFLVFATQNPLEQEGTYRLPEAQLDRFLFKISIGYPNAAQEKAILSSTGNLQHIHSILSMQDIENAQTQAGNIYMDERIVEYIVSLVCATRKPDDFGLSDVKRYIRYGVSPRATRALYDASKAYAFLKKRNFVTPDDVKKVALPIMSHRLLITYEAESEGLSSEIIIKQLLSAVQVP
ncbi:MAG TPA: MoxR family ATPase, partial [Candidatus Babeliaceae bacterium]|nr:MoxR family ATPase [Candidatus Babeliaceae bacterium]